MKVSQCSKCAGCPVARILPDNNVVPPQWGTSLRLQVGEAPGEQENLEEKPFCGGSGKWLDSMLNKAGIKRETLTIVNTMNCRPKDNLFPTNAKARGWISKEDGRKAVGHCLLNHVLPVLEARPWKRVDLLGDKALEFVGGKDSISEWRGSPLDVDSEDVRKRAEEMCK